MFPLIVSLFLLIGQSPTYSYLSEHTTFKECPAFVLSVNFPSSTPKTKIESPLKGKEVVGRVRPLKIDPKGVVPFQIPVGPKVESGEMSQQISSKEISPIKIEVDKRKAPKTSEMVFFEFDSDVLKPSEKIKLDSLSKDIHYRVTGYTCDIGGKEYNDRLALRRAEAVRNYLGDIVKEVVGRGKCCYLDPVDKSKNRRAEIKPLSQK